MAFDLTSVRPRKILRSECGLFTTDISYKGTSIRPIFDKAGRRIEPLWWSNYSTQSRVRFETGRGDLKVLFSYPRYPSWFRRRWVEAFDVDIVALAKLVERLGGAVLHASKVGFSCWNQIGFAADGETLARVDAELNKRGLKWNGPPKRVGQWEIHCPDDIVAAHAEIVASLKKEKS